MLQKDINTKIFQLLLIQQQKKQEYYEDEGNRSLIVTKLPLKISADDPMPCPNGFSINNSYEVTQ